ncbi:MAG: NAD(P)H-dependent oxidoreductase subunit E [Bryobacteraceae bacterium]|nr:NAD(P)H-dependent oxidoreductase subunit E [Bryobacteraceae bacterium]
MNPDHNMHEIVDELVARYNGRPGALLGILEQLQDRHPHKYLPVPVLDAVAARTGIPRAQVYSVVTFYSLFNLEPQGRHTVCICRGTACHTRGSRGLLERLRLELGLKQPPVGAADGNADKLSMTTPDGEFTLRTVACFGQCALAPVVEIDHHIFSHVNEQRLHTEIEALREE